ncbi:MAG: hypothetical protein IJK73_01105 [Bacteroidales bacterium]|nr:hypothetical protein [Bacteroidales bacterium]
MKDVILLTAETVELIYSEDFKKRFSNLVKTLTEKGAIRNMARDKARAVIDLKQSGRFSPETFPGEYIEVLEKRSELPRSRRDVIEMIGNTVLGTIAPGAWKDVTEKGE